MTDAKKSLPSGLAYYDIKSLEAKYPNISRLPVSIRVILESLLRNKDDHVITEQHIEDLATWAPKGERTNEIPFRVARVVLQDYTGVPLLVDLAAMRDAAEQANIDPHKIEPLVPVNLVIDHSVQTNVTRTPDALVRNMELEYKRNQERYQFLKWGMQAFESFDVVPPGIGIVHQVNLEYLGQGVHVKDDVVYPDTMVGTDSHTTMINGIGAVGWGVGGIEAEAAMLGQPYYMLTPDVVGVHLYGRLPEGATATDLVLTLTQILRETNVIGKFVEFFGEDAAHLSIPDRATIANMAPDYGATMGFFGVDEETLRYFANTGRDPETIKLVREYFTAQGLFGMPKEGECDYTQVIELDLSTVQPCVSGPKRPQDYIALPDVKKTFTALLTQPLNNNGYAKEAPSYEDRFDIKDGDVLISAITSCTNTSNPAVLLAAGLLAKKAVEKGLSVHPRIKTSLAPGSRVVTDYLEQANLQTYLDQLGYNLAGYGCTTCIGNVGDLDEDIRQYLTDNDIVGASVLSGNRNFEARIHPNIRANFLMSPPLVVAFGLAGTVNIDLTNEPLGQDQDGNDVFLRDIWPTQEEVNQVMRFAVDPANYRKRYSHIREDAPMWTAISSSTGPQYQWDAESTYIANPPFFEGFGAHPDAVSDIKGARPLAILADSVTTDHISPAGAIKQDSPAGRYLIENGITRANFNSFGARRGNHEVMMRGTFSNVRIKNAMVPGVEGGVTVHKPSGEPMSIYDAGMKYMSEGTPTIILAGTEYGTGSSRDWAAKGTKLLGVHAVVAKSFERIHRSNLIGMGVLPCEFEAQDDVASLGITGEETFDIIGMDALSKPGEKLTLVIHRLDGSTTEVPIKARLDTPVEVAYYQHDGILPYMLRKIGGTV